MTVFLKKEYSYTYEDGVLVRSLEYGIEIGTNENITSRNLVNTIRFDCRLRKPKRHSFGNTLTWEKGRQLKTFDDISYEYNANGIRTAKTVGGGVVNALSGLISNIRSKSFKSVLYNFVIDFTIGALWGALSGNGLADKY